MAEIVDWALKAVIDSFEINSITTLIEKKIEPNFIVSKASFEVAQPKKTQKNIIFASSLRKLFSWKKKFSRY